MENNKGYYAKLIELKNIKPSDMKGKAWEEFKKENPELAKSLEKKNEAKTVHYKGYKIDVFADGEARIYNPKGGFIDIITGLETAKKAIDAGNLKFNSKPTEKENQGADAMDIYREMSTKLRLEYVNPDKLIKELADKYSVNPHFVRRMYDKMVSKNSKSKKNAEDTPSEIARAAVYDAMGASSDISLSRFKDIAFSFAKDDLRAEGIHWADYMIKREIDKIIKEPAIAAKISKLKNNSKSLPHYAAICAAKGTDKVLYSKKAK